MYCLEFILHTQEASEKMLKSSLSEFGESLKIEGCPDSKGRDFMITMNTQDPTVVFDVCSQFGRIKSAKIDEV